MKNLLTLIKVWLASLSYRTGIAVLIACVTFYIISFAQMLLPISVVAKGTLWVIFFGLAKTAQYSALLILGKAGIDSLRRRFRRKPVEDANYTSSDE
ncbi:MAG: hypothetical protein NC217_08755 [Muribaculaceae bacterium]|nr:hypothetical protein [Muribaculaceae bacterium]